MKTINYFFLSLVLFYSCSKDDSSDDTNEAPVVIENVVYDESLDGKLSDDSSEPTVITLASGDNRIIADQATGVADYFTVEIPSGYELAELNVESYESEGAAFIGIGEGDSITGQTAESLLGGLVYGDANIDTDILPEMGKLEGATGFTSPLPSGEYTIWLNQNGDVSSVTLNLVLEML